jgi:NAD(P)-dependent dehydrogenase (short-subunit alcohol dehydrogenase family)
MSQKKEKMSKIILITGTSTGVGLHTASLLAADGHVVYATMRDTSKKKKLQDISSTFSGNLHIMKLDVTNEETIENCVQTILENDGRIDVLVNNAGAGFLRSVEQATMGEIENVMDVNFYGTVRCIKAVLPSMRKQKSGHIINVSSVGGLVGQPLNEIYCAAKFAVEGFTESIATYLKPYFNIKTSIIEPGGILTEFSNNAMNYIKNTGGILQDAYVPVVKDYMDYRATFTDELIARVFQQPQEVAQVIVNCINDPEPHLRYLTSASAAEFTHLKSGLDPTGEQLQELIRMRILKK